MCFVDFCASLDFHEFIIQVSIHSFLSLQTLFIFDDNQDHLKRILHLHKIGVAHAIFDDNYMPGVGPAFSVKDACDGTGHLRQYFNAYSGTDHELVAPKRCDGHHANCEELPFDDKVRFVCFVLSLDLCLVPLLDDIILCDVF